MIEEEMVVERGHVEPVIQCSCHRGINFVLKKDGVAHHHGFSVRAFCKGCPRAESHEWRHGPSGDNDLYVVARKADFINAFLLVHLSLEPGEFVDTRRVEVSSEYA